MLVVIIPTDTQTVVLAVESRDLDSLPFSNLTALQATAEGLSVSQRELRLSDGSTLPFDKLCICTGAAPKARLF